MESPCPEKEARGGSVPGASSNIFDSQVQDTSEATVRTLTSAEVPKTTENKFIRKLTDIYSLKFGHEPTTEEIMELIEAHSGYTPQKPPFRQNVSLNSEVEQIGLAGAQVEDSTFSLTPLQPVAQATSDDTVNFGQAACDLCQKIFHKDDVITVASQEYSGEGDEYFLKEGTYCYHCRTVIEKERMTFTQHTQLDMENEAQDTTEAVIPKIVGQIISKKEDAVTQISADDAPLSTTEAETNTSRQSDSGSESSDLNSTDAEYDDETVGKSPKWVVPDKKLHGLCFCCFGFEFPSIPKYMWGFSHCEDLDVIIEHRNYFLEISNSSADHSKINYTTERAHGMCVCCYLLDDPRLGLASLSWVSSPLQLVDKAINTESQIEPKDGSTNRETAIKEATVMTEVNDEDSRDLFSATPSPAKKAEVSIISAKPSLPITLEQELQEPLNLSSKVQKVLATLMTEETENNLRKRKASGDSQFNANGEYQEMDAIEKKQKLDEVEAKLKAECVQKGIRLSPVLQRPNVGLPLKKRNQTLVLTSVQKQDSKSDSKEDYQDLPNSSSKFKALEEGKTDEQKNGWYCWLCARIFASHQVLRHHLQFHGLKSNDMKKNKPYRHGMCYVESCLARDLAVREMQDHLVNFHGLSLAFTSTKPKPEKPVKTAQPKKVTATKKKSPKITVSKPLAVNTRARRTRRGNKKYEEEADTDK